jgi:hypothetical protein
MRHRTSSPLQWLCATLVLLFHLGGGELGLVAHELAHARSSHVPAPHVESGDLPACPPAHPFDCQVCRVHSAPALPGEPAAPPACRPAAEVSGPHAAPLLLSARLFLPVGARAPPPVRSQ